VIGNLIDHLIRSLPPQPEMLSEVAVRLPNGSGPIPDVLVITPSDDHGGRGIPADEVHTVVEVVSPANARADRVRRRDLYARAGIPCYWRVELQPWPAYRGALPLIVVRIREDRRWRTVLAPAGLVHELPSRSGARRVVRPGCAPYDWIRRR
jgi:Uma2 family endonuclease